MTIYIQPIGLDDDSLLGVISDGVRSTFGVPVEIRPPIPVPPDAFNEGRKQYHSTTILKTLTRLRRADDTLRILGITDADLYVTQLNFVFGEAAIDGLVCIISMFRLRPEFYDLPQDRALLAERAVKEAIHELGHTFGLRHTADPKSVMHFSNTIWDTDRKSAEFSADEESERLRSRRAAA